MVEAASSQTTWHLVAHHKEIPEGMCLQLGVAGHSILLCKVKDQIYCIEDRCSHRDIPLNRGWLEGHEMVCPLHGATFDIRNGHPCRLPAKQAISAYDIRIDEQQRVFVALPKT
ncbi:MAG: Rieske 2Fe-2S domain-containing protein [Myxococcales bacterium]|nr:Rieske 2Fe-2S domain-containing protein [Myxococcales bacterium]MCB9643692.1 Rieske 2Fe-2S domain-containing protein [Myxococcales bacterium]